MIKAILIKTPAIPHQENSVVIHTLSSIPAQLKDALHLRYNKIWMDNNNGFQHAPLGSVICYEKSDKTVSGFNCWSIGRIGIDLVQVEGVFYKVPETIHGVLIPVPDEENLPLWVKSCKLAYNEDGSLATLTVHGKSTTGRVGQDYLMSYGLGSDGVYKASILTTHDEDYEKYLVCDNSGKVIGRLADYNPA